MLELLTPDSIGIIMAICLLDGILSVDNALVIAAVAQGLPEHQRHKAIRVGIIIAMVTRIMALSIAFVIAQIPAIKVIGAGYLLYLVWGHFSKEEGEESVSSKNTFTSVIITIGLIDLAFSVDNVVATVGMSSHLVIIVIGVLASMLILMFAAQIMEGLMRRYPSLAHTAFIIIGFIGSMILVEDFHEFGWHAMTIMDYSISGWQPFEGFYHLEISSTMKFGFIFAAVLAAILLDEIKERNSQQRIYESED
jgi:tellurite resistance protein TerC